MRTHTTHHLRNPPGPRTYPLIGALPQVFRDPLHFFSEAPQRYGDVIGLGNNYFALIGPAEIEHVFQKNHTNYIKGHTVDAVRLMTGNGVLTSDNPLWIHQRRLMQPAFHHKRITAMGHTIAGCIQSMLDRWESIANKHQVIDISTEMVRLSIDIIGKTLFGGSLTISDTSTFHKTLIPAITFVTRRSLSPFQLPIAWPLPSHQHFREHMRALDTIVTSIIAARRRTHQQAPQHDVLAMLLDAQDADTGAHMTDQQLRDEVMTLFLAGHDTSAQTLSWIWPLLDRHPAVVEHLVTEVDHVLAGRTPSAEETRQLAYTWMVLQETMRLYPPAWMVPRSPREADTVGGYPVSPGAVLFVAFYGLHRNPRYWDAPAQFNPQRFAPDQPARHPFAYIPFGAGPRMCIGSGLATMEMIMVLAMILQRYRIELVADHPIVPEPLTVLRPKHGVQVRIRYR